MAHLDPAEHPVPTQREARLTRERIVVDQSAHDDLPHDAFEADRVEATSLYESLPARINAIFGALLLALESVLALRFALVAFGATGLAASLTLSSTSRGRSSGRSAAPSPTATGAKASSRYRRSSRWASGCWRSP